MREVPISALSVLHTPGLHRCQSRQGTKTYMDAMSICSMHVLWQVATILTGNQGRKQPILLKAAGLQAWASWLRVCKANLTEGGLWSYSLPLPPSFSMFCVSVWVCASVHKGCFKKPAITPTLQVCFLALSSL